MESMGLSLGYLLAEAVPLAILIGWPVVSVAALLSLRRRQLPPVAQAVWALLIVAIPWAGAVAFWIVQPEAERE